MASIFISYAWNSGEGEDQWAEDLASGLAAFGHQAIFDKRDATGGGELASFMSDSVIRADVVLVICTPKYAENALRNGSGVMFEMTFIQHRIFKRGTGARVLPLLRSGTFDKAVPAALQPTLPFDVSKMGSDAAQHVAIKLAHLYADLSAPGNAAYPELNLGTLHVNPRNVGQVFTAAVDRYRQLRDSARSQGHLLLWNLRPVHKLSFVHRVYLQCLSDFSGLGFSPLIVFYDLFSTLGAAEDDLEAMCDSCADKARAYRNLATLKHQRLSNLLADTSATGFVRYLASSLRETQDAGPGSLGTIISARNVLDHLTTIYVEQMLKVRAVCSGSYDVKNYFFSEAGSSRSLPNNVSPIVLEFPTVSFGGRQSIEAASDMINEDDDLAAVELKLSRSTETEIAVALGCMRLNQAELDKCLSSPAEAAAAIHKFVRTGTCR